MKHASEQCIFTVFRDQNSEAKLVKFLRTSVDLRRELDEQIHSLNASSISYDQGNLWEAKRLATTSYILLHDGGRRSQSLLTQLALRQGLHFLSSTRHAAAGSPLPLAHIQGDFVDGTFTYVPFFDAHPEDHRLLKFSKWYSESVFETERGKKLSRQNLIFAMRNQLGGSHVDSEITDEAVHWLVRGPHTITAGPWTDQNGIEFREAPFAAGAYSGPVPNGHYATMRQIAWELSRSLESARI